MTGWSQCTSSASACPRCWPAKTPPRVAPRVVTQAAAPTPAAASAAATPATISLKQYEDCELLWLEHRASLSISKRAALWALQDVQRGRLPCDAEVLRGRAQAFAALGQAQGVPGLDALRVLNSSRHALRQEPRHVLDTLQRLLQLLPPGSCWPHHQPTALLLNTLRDLDLPPEILAVQQQELDAAFMAALSCRVRPAMFHHLTQRWRRQQRGSSDQQQQQPGDARPTLFGAGTAGPLVSSSGGRPSPAAGEPAHLGAQLQSLRDLLGPELAAAALDATPSLLDAPPSQLAGNLWWLQTTLALTPAAALLLAEAAGGLLLLPLPVLQARHSNIVYLLQQLLGWRLRAAHSLLCNHPRLLLLPSARLAARWQRAQQLARRRGAWLRELAGGEAGMVAAVLGARPRQLQQLRYAADAQELRGWGLGQVLRLPYVDLLRLCPGFTVWRGLAPAEQPPRCSLVEEEEEKEGEEAEDGGAAGGSVCRVVAGAAGGAAGRPPRGRVLAADARGQPVLIQLRETLGPHDRLVA